MIKKALEYLNKDISIIPVGKDKKPLIKWQEFQERRATKEEVEQWFKDYPETQIGIVCGKISDLIVVDIDEPNMNLNWLPETAIVKTGSGGFHYYYKYTGAFKNKTRIRENIDIRADGGYVVAPPSWNEKGQYQLIKRMNLTPFPLHLFTNQPKEYKQIDSTYEGFGEGQRNNQMTRYIGHLLVKVHPSEWETIAWNITKEANQKNNPPLLEHELRSIFNSISGKERHNSKQRWYKSQEPELTIKVKKDYKNRYTWGTRGLDTSMAIIKRGNFIIVGAKRGSGKTTFTFDMACKNAMLGHKVLYISLEMEEDKIKEDFARKYAGITVGEEYDYIIPDTKQTAYEKRIKEINSIPNLFFRGMRRGSNVSLNSIIELINEFSDIDLVFIDNLDLIEGNKGENDWERQKRITKKIMGITIEKQLPIILIHHYRKRMGKDNGSDELSGSGKIADNADIIININKCYDTNAEYPEKYKSIIHQQKSRGYPETIKIIYFIKGSFEDEAPPYEEYDPYFNSLKNYYGEN